jgi:peroxiredoxin
LHQRKDEFDKNNLEIVLVFESRESTIKKYIKDQKLPFTMVSDVGQNFYNLYAVEKSWSKLIQLFLTRKGIVDCLRGFSKFKKFSSMKGSTNRVEAEFLIDENGILEKVHYGKTVGDHMPVSYYLK